MTSTTFRGDVAEMMAAAELVRRGYIVSRPLTNGAPYDLLVDDGRAVFKVQVKRTCLDRENDSVRIQLSSSKYHRGRAGVSYAGRVDMILAVDCEASAFYVVAGADLERWEIRIRTAPALNNQTKGTRSPADYAIDRAFPTLAGSHEHAPENHRRKPLTTNDILERNLPCEGSALPLS
ncbi:MAG: group I intron-associated PD-(D/E)XK endonuclease [Xanthobacteraceae bacterium]|nr:group I intron-associated PD-(D/E)XK endonuclease [Xanthobacteraceae bacterium]